MTMMVAGAVLIHFGIVRTGAMWQPPAVGPARNFVTLVDPAPPSDPGVQILPVHNDAPIETPDSSTPTPSVPLPSDLSPPPVVPEMLEPSDATPPPAKPRHTTSRVTNAPATANLAHALTGNPGTSGNSFGTTAGASGSGRAGDPAWKTPRPPYPQAALAYRFQGATTVRITTDAEGNVATVEIVRAAGNALLDHNTQTYVREFWKGPPNATRTTEFVYQIP